MGKNISKTEDIVNLDDFIFIKMISKGAFGRVWLVKRKITGEYYAMKIINFADKLTNNHLNMIKHENEIFKMVKGEMFVNAIFTFSHENFICFVIEFMYGGDLAALLQKEVYFREDIVRYYIAEIIQAVDSLHKIGIIHRDLKPDNVLIDSQGHLRLTDFGLSDLGVLIQRELVVKNEKNIGYFNKKGLLFQDFKDHSFCNLEELEKIETFNSFDEIKTFENSKKISKKSNIIGTPDYMSPEVLNGTGLRDPAIDWWSVGIILFELLTGIPPFNAETPEKIFENIKGHLIPWDQISIGYDEGCLTPEAQDLIRKLLDADPKKRLGLNGAKEIQNHRFFRGVDWNNLRKRVPIYIPKVDNITNLANFEKKINISDKEKNNPFFSAFSNDSQKISEATNLIKSLESFNIKRSDMLYEENEKILNNFYEEKKEIQEKIDKHEFDLKKVQNLLISNESLSLPSIELISENINTPTYLK